MKKVILILFFMFSSLFSFEELTLNNFESKIKDKDVVVDFYAPWCPPCKILAQNLEDFDTLKPENVEVFKVNIDNQMALAEKYGVSALPTVLFFKNGKLINKHVGVLDTNELLENSTLNFK